MTYGQLQSYLARQLHRDDLSADIPNFIQRASEEIGRRFGIKPLPLVNVNDTNNVLDNQPSIYISASMVEAEIFLENEELAQRWRDRFKSYCSDMNVNYHGADWDVCDPPYVCPDNVTGCATDDG